MSERPTILLVDDDPHTLKALEALLSGLHCRTRTARSGQETLRVLLQEDIALVLLDLQMPGLNGYETAALIRQREKTRHIPIIFLTGYYEKMDLRKAYSYRPLDCIFKPLVVPELLTSKIEAFLDLYHTLRREAENG